MIDLFNEATESLPIILSPEIFETLSGADLEEGRYCRMTIGDVTATVIAGKGQDQTVWLNFPAYSSAFNAFKNMVIREVAEVML